MNISQFVNLGGISCLSQPVFDKNFSGLTQSFTVSESETKTLALKSLDEIYPGEHLQKALHSVAEIVVKMLENIGVQYAFGVSGDAIAPILHRLHHSLRELYKVF